MEFPASFFIKSNEHQLKENLSRGSGNFVNTDYAISATSGVNFEFAATAGEASAVAFKTSRP